MDSAAHRPIELQSPEDFTYLIDNVRRAAADSINAAFPPVDDTTVDAQEDELRDRIEQLVNDYILKTFTLAAQNLTINGLPVDDPSPYLASLSAHHRRGQPPQNQQQQQPQVQIEYEPFDARKRDRIEELVSQEEDLLRSIAQLKRRVPRATAARWAEAAGEGLAADEAALEAVRARVEEEGGVSGKKALEGMGELDRQDGVEGRFREAVEALGRLKRDMPAAVAKMERARVAAGYVTGSTTGR
ncbi:Kinetochore protein mis14 [Madurella fahalii]|uniref:Kinetochore protein mis14 n=1 Tax=Madurella fahalii TaxID=1157608 RepID=A0ABQ0GIF8_9PEZI